MRIRPRFSLLPLLLLLFLPVLNGCGKPPEASLLAYEKTPAVITLRPVTPAGCELLLTTGPADGSGFPMPVSLEVRAPEHLRGITFSFGAEVNAILDDLTIPLRPEAAAGLSLWPELFRIPEDGITSRKTVVRDGRELIQLLYQTDGRLVTIWLDPDSGLPVHGLLETDGVHLEAAVAAYEVVS